MAENRAVSAVAMPPAAQAGPLRRQERDQHRRQYRRADRGMKQNQSSHDAQRAELRTLLGDAAVLDQPTDVAAFVTDWRGRYTGRTIAVAQPRSTLQVSQLLAWCAARGVPIVPQGGNTGLVGGATPDESGSVLLLSTRRLDRVRQIDTANDTMTVEAGCLLQNLQEAALAQNRLFPLSLAAEGSCTIGGNLATNAGGTQVLRYGNTRDLTLGLEAVLADGTVWDGLRGLRKDNTGYDLKQLFIGSEGTLGVITAATLKLFPVPRARVVSLVALADLSAAIRLLERARSAAGPALTAFELMSRICLDLVEQVLPLRRPAFAPDHRWLALLEWSDHEDEAHATRQCAQMYEAAIEGGDALDVVISHNLRDCDALWQLRESIPEAQARQGGNVKHDISLPISCTEAFVHETELALERLCPELRTLVFGHLGDGNLHFNVATKPGIPVSVAFEREQQINEIVYGAVARFGGSVSAEHGIGQLRRDLLKRTKSATEMGMMHSIKKAFDPQGIMNPGKLI
jgi:FAD/FMN-containing dehydrogenase